MRKSVLEGFSDWVVQFEGYTDYMYLDVIGLVTTGIGFLIDPIDFALTLPWKHKDGRMATEAEIEASWRAVKAARSLSPLGGKAFAPLTALRLSKADVDVLTRRKLLSNWGVLSRRYPKAEEWPADAQMGVCSMAWAAGPNFRFPMFSLAANESPPNFLEMAAQCRMKESNKASQDRNVANRVLFENAHRVQAENLDPEILRYGKADPFPQTPKLCPTCKQVLPA